MATEEFKDYYEALELSPNANSETVERVFRYFATRYHPDAGETGNKERFSLLVKAHETLKDPELRTAYDVEYQKHQQLVSKLVEDAGEISRDSADRLSLLSLFYAKRRRDMKNPGVGLCTVEHAVSCPPEVLQFHIWYFREKGWLQREESGGFSITAEGVDQIEKTEQKTASTEGRLITQQPGTGSEKVSLRKQEFAAQRR